MQFKVEQKKKTRSSYPCKHCGVDIEIGEMYTAVTYSDGFKQRLHGAYHDNCWKVTEDNPRAKKNPK